MKLLIKGGQVVDTVGLRLIRQDVLIEDGLVAALGNLDGEDAEVLAAEGLLVAPGLIDLHTHLREPGYEAKETIFTGARAAVRGGFTCVQAMPNTRPVTDSGAVAAFVRRRAMEAGWAEVLPAGAITVGQEGRELAPLGELKEAGVLAVSDDGHGVVSAGLMLNAMRYARMCGLMVISHCEDATLSAGGAMNEGYTATRLGLKGMPALAEEVMVARDILLAGETLCRLHIAHISTAGSVRAVREAKARGVPVTAEATPHHFTLTEEACEGYDTDTKVNPPLRGARDVAAVLAGLADGTVDAVATDHAPHTRAEKEVEFDLAPFGICGLETAVPLVFTELVHKGVVSAARAVALLSREPARILGLPAGVITLGAPADLTLIDPGLERTVDPASFESKGRNTPFSGRRLTGWPVAVVKGGRVLMRDGKLTAGAN
ncbi:MAG: dihydroorotase [Peptococcaceae bacterium]|jgi:dihydroorotase|nr:dihydroorotase [Peptococcaceae bacterium]